MVEFQGSSVNWNDDFSVPTPGPSISMSLEDEVPTLTVATILGVTIVILLAIVLVFVLGILIDCRQQRVIDKKVSDLRRLKLKKTSPRANVDEISIANNMEAQDTSTPPLEEIRYLP